MATITFPRGGAAWPLAMAVSVLADLFVAALVWRGGRDGRVPWLGARVTLDSLDVSFWWLVAGVPADMAALLASPLAFEAGLRRGWRGLVAPLTVGSVSNLAALAAHRAPQPGPLLWPSIALVFGVVVAFYVRSRFRHVTRRADQLIQGAASHAELAGQNSVAMGADTVVDLITRTTPLIDLATGEFAPSRLAQWRRALADATSGQAVYLGVALARWQRAHNERTPFLDLDVTLRCDEGAGTLLLTSAQAEELGRRLDEAHLRGAVRVSVPSVAPPGREQAIMVGGAPVTLPVDPLLGGRLLDLGPVAFMLAGVLFLSQSIPWFDDVPPSVTGGLFAAALIGAWWSQRAVERRGEAAHARVMLVAVMLGAADSIITPVTAGYTGSLPNVISLQWLIPLFVVYVSDLSWAARVGLVAAEAIVLVASFSLRSQPLVPVQWLQWPAWPVAVLLIAAGLRAAVSSDVAEIQAALRRRYREAMEASYGSGRRLVVKLAAEAALDARQRYERDGQRLERAVAMEVESRLAEAERRLADLASA